MDTLMRTLPDGTQVVAVWPQVLHGNLSSWQNGWSATNGVHGIPRVFEHLPAFDEYHQVINLLKDAFNPYFFLVSYAGNKLINHDHVLWIEVVKPEIIDALDLVSVAGDLLVDAPYPETRPVSCLNCGSLDTIETAPNWFCCADCGAAFDATPAADESLCNVEPVGIHVIGFDTVAFELTQAGRELAATLKFRRQPRMFQLTDKARALLGESAGVS